MFKVDLATGENYSFTKEGESFLDSNGNTLDFIKVSDTIFHLIINGKSMVTHIDKVDYENKTVELRVNNKPTTAKLSDKMDLLLKSMGLEDALTKKMNEEKAPMPGLVLSVSIAPGDAVQKGDALLVLEAMKMENVIKASGDGVVKEVKVQPQQAVEKNEVLVTFE